MILVAGAVGCRRSYPMAKLSVRAVDDQDAPVGGVAADLYKVTASGRVYWRASRTSGNGIAIFGGEQGVIEGDYIVRVSPLAFQRLAPGEPNDRSVHLKEGDDVVVTFRVIGRRPAPAPVSER